MGNVKKIQPRIVGVNPYIVNEENKDTEYLTGRGLNPSVCAMYLSSYTVEVGIPVPPFKRKYSYLGLTNSINGAMLTAHYSKIGTITVGEPMPTHFIQAGEAGRNVYVFSSLIDFLTYVSLWKSTIKKFSFAILPSKFLTKKGLNVFKDDIDNMYDGDVNLNLVFRNNTEGNKITKYCKDIFSGQKFTIKDIREKFTDNVSLNDYANGIFKNK